MKKSIILILVMCMSISSISQVGVNTTSPNAQLDVRSSNQATPIATDGILVPKVDVFPTGVNANQDAMLVYLTTTVGSNTPGFYYYNHATTTWLSIGNSGAEKINDLIDGKSDNDGTEDGSSIFLGIGAGTNDDGTDNRSIGLGLNALSSSTTGFANVAFGYDTMQNTTTGVFNTAIGYSALRSNLDGAANIAIGSASLLENLSGTNNVAVGNDAMRENTIGVRNTALGDNSLRLNSIGNNNTGIGYLTLNNTTSDENTAVGSLSLFDNTVGTRNTALGYATLYENTTGSNNTALGRQSLQNNTIGYDNIGVGALALQENTEGLSNVAIGNSALRFNTISSNNTAIGTSSLRLNVTGDNNTSVGYESLYNSSTGSENTSIGYAALRSITTGGQNVAVGVSSGSSISTGSNNVFLGYYAGFAEGGSNKLYIDNNYHATPLIYGEFDNSYLQINGTLDINGVYSFPTSGGSAGQVLANNGSGQLIWQLFSDVDDDSINNLSDGKTNAAQNSIFLGQSAGQNDSGSTLYNIGIGPFALQANTAGEQNTALGNGALANNVDGDNNVGIGNAALYFNTSGLSNVAIGTNALQNNLDGNANTAIGYFSQTSNSSGNYNTSLGAGASRFNTSGFNNTAVGTDALRSNTSSSNTAIGSQALRNATGGSNVAIGHAAALSQVGAVWNVAIGSNALYSNTETSANIAIGHEALYTNSGTINNENVAIGHEALRNANAGYNIGIGSGALMNNVGTGGNVVVGSNALNSNIIGGGNVVIGHGAGVSNNGSNNIFLGIGSAANETGSNKLYIESSNADSNNALIYGEFDTNLIRFNGRTEITATTDASGVAGTGVLEIANALRLDGNEIITNANATLFIQSDNNGDLEMDGGTFRMDASTNRVGVRTATPDYAFSVAGEANLNEGLTGVAMRVNGDEAIWYNNTYFSWGFGGTANYFADNVGLGITAPSTKLHIVGGTDVSPAGGGYVTFGNLNGWNIAIDDNEIMARDNGAVADLNLQAEGGNVRVGGAVVHASDRRLKKNIEDLEYSLNELLLLQPKQYHWKNRETSQYKSFGLIAQDVQKIMPELVLTGNDEDKTLSVNYTELIPILLNAVQEQQQKIEALESQLENNKSLEARIAALEAKNSK